MNEVVDLSFVDRLPSILERRDQLTDSIRENCRSKINVAEDRLEVALEEIGRLIKRRAPVMDELELLDLIATSLALQVAVFRRAALRMTETPTQFWQDEQE